MASTCRGCGRDFRGHGVHLGLNRACRAHYYTDSDEECEDFEDADFAREVQNDMFHNKRLNIVFEFVAELFFFRYLGETLVKVIMGAINNIVAFTIHELEDDLSTIVGRDKVPKIMELLRDRFDIFRGLRTEAQARARSQTHASMPLARGRQPPNPHAPAHGCANARHAHRNGCHPHPPR